MGSERGGAGGEPARLDLAVAVDELDQFDLG
jgi:hypothetical protein